MSKKADPLQYPPTASSSDDEEADSSSGEEDGSSSSDEEVHPTPPPAPVAKKPSVSSSSEEEDDPISPSPTVSAAAKKPTVSATAKQPTVSSSGSESEEAGSDSESEEAPPKNPNPGSGKSIAAAPVTVAFANSKMKEKVTSSAALALPALKIGAKRPNEGTSRDDGNGKRAKQDTTSGEDSKKSVAFQRKWSETDEMALLKAMISFAEEKGISPYADTNQFYEYATKLITYQVTKSQMMDKLRSLKNKYMGKKMDRTIEYFSKPHDVEAYPFAKLIWGVGGLALESTKSNGLSKKSKGKMKKLKSVKQDLFASASNGRNVEGGVLKMSDWFENSFLVRSIAGFGTDELTVIKNWRSLPIEVKKKIEAGMKGLRAKEFEYVILKAQFMSEAMPMIAEAVKDRDM